MRKNGFRWLIMVLLPLLAVAILFYSLETYYRVVHSDASVLIGFFAVVSIVIELRMWLKGRRIHWGYTAVAAISIAILLAVMYVGDKIPFCVECDQVTAEDLGFLIRWIKPLE